MFIRYLPWQVLFATCALAQSTVAIDNDAVKVIKAYAKPFERTPLHEHVLNRVMIFEQAGRQEILDAHRKPYAITFHAGEVQWSPGGGMHMSRISTPDPVPMVEIEIKQPGTTAVLFNDPLDPVKVDPKHYKVEFENNQVRVLRVTIGPHESTPMHHHTLDRVVTYLTAQDFRVTSKDGKVTTAKQSAGDVTWAGPAIHKEQNLSDKSFEVIVTELKK